MSKVFNRVTPSPDQLVTLNALRASFKETEIVLVGSLPPGRYKQLALTYLEISAMFANKAITHHNTV